MREAVGGTWLLYFFFIFMFVYIVFITIIMNYASAYRTNNHIISELESYEGNVDWNTVKNDVKKKFSYTNGIGFCCSRNSSNGVIYRIETYINFELPLIGGSVKIPIQNDSKTVYEGACSYYDYCR